jgi:peptidoglycan/LPS O-acetylase OafA/YrhL
MKTESSSLSYRPEIDGLRALAVVPVVLFHMGVPFLSGGYAGVDVFFVISGYLISLIIIKESYNSKFSYKNFWLRRVRRIMPALLVMVIVTSIVGSFLLYGPDVTNLGRQGLASVFSYANIEFLISAGSYWGVDAKSSPLLHTWSLSVEEQFYLFFPAFLILLLARLKSSAVSILSLICILSFLLFVYGVYSHPSATFYLLPMRAWELGAGSLLALLTYHRPFSFKYNNVFAIVGVLAVISSYFLIGDENNLSYYLIIPVVGAVLIIATSANSNSLVHKFLASRMMVLVGLASYSIYLWHWPILTLLKAGLPLLDSYHIALYSIPLIVLFSALSYLYVEKRMRDKNQSIFYILLLFLVSLIFSFTLLNKHLTENVSMYSQTSWFGEIYNVAPPSNFLSEAQKRALEVRMEGIFSPKPEFIQADLYEKGGSLRMYGGKTPEVIVFGDSHALMWAPVLNDIFKELKVSVSFYAANGTPTFFNIPVSRKKNTQFFSTDEKFIFDKKRLYFLHKWKPKLVIIAARWSEYSVEDARDLMGEINKVGAHVLLLEDPPVLYFGDKNTPQYLSYLNIKPNNKQYVRVSNIDKFRQGNELVHQLRNLYNNCDYLSVADTFMYNNKVWVLDKNDVLYIDDDHLSYKGVLKVRGRLTEKIKISLNIRQERHLNGKLLDGVFPDDAGKVVVNVFN